MPFQKGQSGNPLGRRPQSEAVKLAIANNGEQALRRMTDILNDDTAFGKGGWIAPKDQITLLEKAQDRAFGRAESLNVSHSHSHSGTIEAKHATATPSLKHVQQKLPEKKAQAKVKADVIDAKVVGGN